MEMHQVRYFLAAARLLNFTRAALECHVSQPSLTKAILKLEEEFGGPLFRRERARTHLTELGKAMQPHLQRTYDAAQAARQLARQMERSDVAPLSIGISRLVPDAGLTAIFTDLSARLSGIEIEVASGTDAELLERAMAGSLDVVMLIRPKESAERLDAWTLFHDAFCIAVAPDHPLADRADPPADLLEAQAWIDLAGDGCAVLADHVSRDGYGINVRHHAQSIGVVRHLVLGGLGCGWVPRASLPDGLHACAAEVPGSDITIVVAAVAGRKRSIGAEAFLRACRAAAWPMSKPSHSHRHSQQA